MWYNTTMKGGCSMTYQTFCKTYHISKLNPQQEKAVKKIDGATLLLAVPGSGKTTVIVTRTGYMLKVKGIPASNILTLTYTRAAATEMKERFIKKFGTSVMDTPHFATINSFCLSVIRTCTREKGVFIPTLLQNNERLVRELAIPLMPEYPSDSSVKQLCQQIGKAKNEMLEGEALNTIENPDVDFTQFFYRYREAMRQQNLMDFDDQLIMAHDLLQTYPDILQRAQQQYRYISLDEAQDTSLIQHKIVEMLVGKTGNIFMVGDEDQSIYGFRGAYPKALLDFKQTYPHADILFMETNYRSDASIVNTANVFIKRNESRNDKNMKPSAKTAGNMKLTKLNDMQQEPQYLFDAIQQHLASPGDSTLAILYRNNDSAIPLTKLLQERHINVRERDATSATFFSHFIINDILMFMRFIQNPYDFELFRNLYYKMGMYLRKSDLEDIYYAAASSKKPILQAIQSISRFRKQAYTARDIFFAFQFKPDTPPVEIIKTIVHGSGGWTGYWNTWLESRFDNGLSKTAANMKINILRLMANWYKTLPDFLNAMDELKNIESDPTSRVTLSTIHSSKGLEFDKVIMIDVIDSILPQTNPKMTAAENEEEARLFYVGATRAKHELEFVVCEKFFNMELDKSEFLAPYEAATGQILEMNAKTKAQVDTKEVKIAAAAQLQRPTNAYLAYKEKQKKDALTPAEYDSLKPGDDILHTSFGRGTIAEINKTAITVDFAKKKVGRKRLLIEFCKNESMLIHLRHP